MSGGKLKDDRAVIDRQARPAANLKSFNVLRLSYCQSREFLIKSLQRVGEMPASFPTVSFSGAVGRLTSAHSPRSAATDQAVIPLAKSTHNGRAG
jgi:hypothetical protein